MKTGRTKRSSMRGQLPPGIRVILVDDHVMVTSMLNLIFRRYLKLEVVGIAGTGAGAVELIHRTKPDVVILDLGLPDMPVRQLLRRVLAVAGQAKVIANTSLSHPFNLHLLSKSGLHGFVDKIGKPIDTFREAIAIVLAGRIYRPDWFASKLEEVRGACDTFVNVLSEREEDVLELIGEARDDAQIARDLEVTPATIRTYRSRIMRKLKCRSTPELIRYAIAQGFTVPECSPAYRSHLRRSA